MASTDPGVPTTEDFVTEMQTRAQAFHMLHRIDKQLQAKNATTLEPNTDLNNYPATGNILIARAVFDSAKNYSNLNYDLTHKSTCALFPTVPGPTEGHCCASAHGSALMEGDSMPDAQQFIGTRAHAL